VIVDNFTNLISRLRDRFNTPLPGWEAQLKMASLRRLNQGKVLSPPDGARLGSVLVLLYPVKGKAFIAFIRRNEYEGIHSGQISFPGGREEAEDHSHADTALREAWEETGIVPDKVEVLGELTQIYIPPSNFLVFPVVAVSWERPEFRPDPNEVQEIIEIETERLKKPGTIQQREIALSEDFSIMAPCYQVDGVVIWGATAMILSELLELT
jgi:8-oxo-dGTP pyrophosphatase MutT (NUDIX family)